MSDSVKQHRPAVALLEQAAFAHNLNRARELTPNCKIMAIIKADGYGHGMELAADNLAEADEFGVNGLDDLERLRKHGVDKALNLLSANLTVTQLNGLSALNARTVCFDFEQLDTFEQIDAGADLAVWIKVDTGMGRLGFSPEELPLVYKRLSAIEGIRSVSLMTHLANADTPGHPCNGKQIHEIKVLASEFEFDDFSILNSAGLIAYSDAAESEVRPGLLLYGISPVNGLSASDLNLKPVMTFKSELISVKRLPAGSSIGYGGTYTLEADTRIGVIAAGYGDGYPRHAPTGTPVLLNGMYVPLIGRVSMDMITVDLGEMPAQLGDEAILWGEDNPVEAIAKAAGTIAYELTCGVLPRVQRIVV